MMLFGKCVSEAVQLIGHCVVFYCFWCNMLEITKKKYIVLVSVSVVVDR